MTKQLTPLRRKDQATGYQAAVRDIVAWLREGESYSWLLGTLAHGVEAKFGKANGPNNVASIQGESSALDSLK